MFVGKRDKKLGIYYVVIHEGRGKFFLPGGETGTAAELCVKYGKTYVTIDCKHDTYLHRHASINVVSKECTETAYAGMDKEEIYALLADNTEGLVIITSGENDMIWGRNGQSAHHTFHCH